MGADAAKDTWATTTARICVTPRPSRACTLTLLCALGLAPCPAIAAEQVLQCSYAETITGTNGRVQQSARQEIARIQDGEYSIWNAEAANWGHNLCEAARCSLSGSLFRFDDRYSSREDGYELRHDELRTIDLSSGRAESRTVDSTTFIVPGREVETTTYEEGSCRPVPDPSGAGAR